MALDTGFKWCPFFVWCDALLFITFECRFAMFKLIKMWLWCVAYVRLSNQFGVCYVSLSAPHCLVQKGLAVRGGTAGGRVC